ncbi:uncharacterized protein LOC124170267 isoform X2 [Ischnura elegans]|uniref:uncharacterized protein LOC124170267 isoform X2 n=1 Tax=Ischnura elegans TaxID=197161 RepID=UPI001ED8BA16|nr:uncharacterized protein LOC124170267 isoform X2 [Ischnura elegans]
MPDCSKCCRKVEEHQWVGSNESTILFHTPWNESDPEGGCALKRLWLCENCASLVNDPSIDRNPPVSPQALSPPDADAPRYELKYLLDRVKFLDTELWEVKMSPLRWQEMMGKQAHAIKTIESAVYKLRELIDGFVSEFTGHKTFISSLANRVGILERELLERVVEIRGIPCQNGECVDAIVEQVGLSMGVVIDRRDLDYARRIRLEENNGDGSFRHAAISARFLRCTDAEKFVAAARAKENLCKLDPGSKGSPTVAININPSLALDISNRSSCGRDVEKEESREPGPCMSKPSSGIATAMSGRGAVASHPPSIHQQSSVGHAREKVVDGRSSLQRSINAKLSGGSNLPQPVNSTANSRFSSSHNQGARRDNCNSTNNTNASSRLGGRTTGVGLSTQSSKHPPTAATGRVSSENNRPRDGLPSVTVTNSSSKGGSLNASAHPALRVSPSTNSAPFHNDESSSNPSVLPVQNMSLSVGHVAKSGIPSPTGSTRMGLQPVVNNGLKSRDSGSGQHVPTWETNGVCKGSSSERDALDDAPSKTVPSSVNGVSSRTAAPHSVPSNRTAIPNGPSSRLGGQSSLANSSRSLGAPAVNVKSIGNKSNQGPTSPRGGNQRVTSKHVPATVNSSSSSWSIWSKVSSSTSQPLQNGHPSSPNGVVVRPRVVTVIRNGSSRPRKVVRLLLNRRTAPCFNSALSALTHAIKLDSGAVRKVFTLDGTPVTCLEDFFREDDIFVAYGSERYSRDDFDLDLEELKAVRQQAKSSASLRRLAPLRPSSPGRIRRDADGFISRECTGSSLGGGGGGVSRRTSSQARPGMPPKTKPQRRRGVSGGTSKVMPSTPVLGRPRLPSAGANGARVPSGSRNGVAEGVEFVEISSMEVTSHSGGDMSSIGVEGVVQDIDEEECAMEIPEEISEEYDVGRIIGDGNFAVVRECTKRDDGTKYALKVIDRSKCRGREHMVESEVAVLRRVIHPNIVGLHAEFHSPTELYLVLELVKGGDLFDAIASASKFTEDVASHMIRDLASALCYLHSLQIVHRDIKPENLLVVEEGGAAEGTRLSLKLGDFGLAQVVTEPLFTVCGTPTYVAPEILAETGYGLKVDIWAAGVIAYILLCGFPPFVSANNDQEELFDRILRGHFSFPASHWEHVSPSARDLVSHMLRVDPELRFSAEDVLDHPWVPLAIVLGNRRRLPVYFLPPNKDGDMGNGFGGGGPESDIRARVYEELGMRFDGGQMVEVDQQNHHGEVQSQDDDADEDDDDDEDDAKLLSSTESQQCYHALEVV